MTAHPDMVSGERRNDLTLMRAGRGDWVTKVGAEGVQAVGVHSRTWGIAIKVVDGNARGLHPATVAVRPGRARVEIRAYSEDESLHLEVHENGTTVNQSAVSTTTRAPADSRST